MAHLNPWNTFKTERDLLISVIGMAYGPEPELVKNQIREDRRIHAERLTDWLVLQPDDVVVDFGSGVGFIAEWIAPKVKQLYCLDIGEHHLSYTQDHLRSLRNVECVLIDYADFSRLEGVGVTKLYSAAVMIHFNFWDIATHLERIFAVLSPGGAAHIDFQSYDNYDVRSDAMWREQLKSYQTTGSPTYLVTWHSAAAIQRLANSIGFLTKITHSWGSNVGILFEKPLR